MPEHVHLLIAPPDGVDLDVVLASIKQPFAMVVIARWRKLDAPILRRITVSSGYRFWMKGGGFGRNVRDEEEFTKTVRYIHENPVERGLAKWADEYELSSARWWLARHRGESPPTGQGIVACDDPPGEKRLALVEGIYGVARGAGNWYGRWRMKRGEGLAWVTPPAKKHRAPPKAAEPGGTTYAFPWGDGDDRSSTAPSFR